MRQLFTSILFLTIISSYGQHPAASQSGYNPTVPRLVGMRHKAVSHTYKTVKPTLQDFVQKISKEEINVYVVYEKDSIIGTGRGEEELLHPPKKLMDMYLVYDYTFKIFAESNDEISNNIPKVNVSTGAFMDDLSIINYFIDEKGKLKDKKIRKSGVSTEINNGVLSVSLDKEQLANNSCTVISIQLKSKNFSKIVPSISTTNTFDKLLTLSYPSIFRYKMPGEFKTELNSTSTFELLHFKRDAGAGNSNIDKIKVDSNTYTWKLPGEGQHNMEFELDGIHIPSRADIGIEANDLLKY